MLAYINDKTVFNYLRIKKAFSPYEVTVYYFIKSTSRSTQLSSGVVIKFRIKWCFMMFFSVMTKT